MERVLLFWSLSEMDASRADNCWLRQGDVLLSVDNEDGLVAMKIERKIRHEVSQSELALFTTSDGTYIAVCVLV